MLHETGLMYDSIQAKIVNRDAYGQRKKEVDVKMTIPLFLSVGKVLHIY